MPPDSANYGDWNSNRFLRWAREYGPYTYEVVDRIFTKSGAEQKYYNGVRSLLKLADKYTRERVEKACQIALAHKQKPTYLQLKKFILFKRQKSNGSLISKYFLPPIERLGIDICALASSLFSASHSGYIQ